MINHDTRRGRLLLAIQALAGLGQWLDIFLIFSVPSFAWKTNPAQIATLAMLLGLPSLLLGPIFGAFADRNDPRRLMLVGSSLRALLSFFLAFAPGFQSFACLVLVKGLSNLLYWPAASIVTNATVADVDRAKYFADLSVSDQIAKVCCPLIAGALMVWMPGQLVFLLSGAAGVASFGLLAWRANWFASNRASSLRNVTGLLADLARGFASYRRLPASVLAGAALLIAMAWVLAIYDPHLASFLRSVGFDPSAFSVVVSSTAIGAVAAALCVRIAFRRSEPTDLMRLGAILFSAAVIGAALVVDGRMGVRLSKPLLAAIWCLNGFGYELFMIGSSVNLQNRSPRELLGRISTSQRSVQLLAVVFGPTVGAWFIADRGRRAPFEVSACLALLVLAAAVIWYAIARRVRVEAQS